MPATTPAFRDVATTNPGGVGTVSLTAPSTVQAGDMLIAILTYSGFAGPYNPNDTGWTTDSDVPTTGNTFIGAHAFVRTAVAGDAGRTFTWTYAGGSTTISGVILAYSGQNGTTFDGEANTNVNSSSAPTAPSVTPAVGGTELVIYVTESTGAMTVGGGCTIRAQVSAGNHAILVADRAVGSGATGTVAGTSPFTNWAADAKVIKGFGVQTGAVTMSGTAGLTVGGIALAYGGVGRASEDFSGGMPADIYASGTVAVVSDYGNPGNSIKGGVGDWWWFTSARFPVSGDFDYFTDVILNPDGGTGDDRALLGFWSDGNGGSANGFKFRLGSHTDGNNGFSRVTNGAGEATIGTVLADVAAATWYRVHLSGRGNSVTATVTRISDGVVISSTTVDLTSSLNSTHPARGTFGQFNGGGTTTSGHRWDNILLSQAGMQATAGMTVGGAVKEVAAVTMTGVAALSVAAKATQFAAVSMSAVAALSTSGSATAFGLAAMSAAAALSVAGTRVLVGTVTMAAASSLTAAPGPVTNVAAVTLTGVGSLTVPSGVTVRAAVTLVGVGTITVPAIATTTGVVSMAAVAALVTSGIPVAFGKYPPDGILLQTNLAGALATVQDDPDAADASWMTGTGGAVVLRLSFPTPPNTLFSGAGQQRFRVLVRYGP